MSFDTKKKKKAKHPVARILFEVVLYVSHLEGGKPHEPVQPVVVRRYETRPAVHVPRLAQELVLLPNRRRVLGILTQSALENHLGALLGNAAGRRWSNMRRARSMKTTLILSSGNPTTMFT